jgi:hypothetical protein
MFDGDEWWTIVRLDTWQNLCKYHSFAVVYCMLITTNMATKLILKAVTNKSNRNGNVKILARGRGSVRSGKAANIRTWKRPPMLPYLHAMPTLVMPVPHVPWRHGHELHLYICCSCSTNNEMPAVQINLCARWRQPLVYLYSLVGYINALISMEFHCKWMIRTWTGKWIQIPGQRALHYMFWSRSLLRLQIIS